MGHSAIQVMKFGGASVKDATSILNVVKIIDNQADKSLLVVVSAMDKTTNQLECLAELAKESQENEAWEQFERIKEFHYGVSQGLFPTPNLALEAEIEGYFLEIKNIIKGILLLQDFPPRTYDRIVSFGEMLSSAILFHAVKSKMGEKAVWQDVRKIIRTDASFTHAQVVWSLTRNNITEIVLPFLRAGKVVITQGFIASSLEGKITTLGREGSDYTAAIFANGLDAEKMIVWKDVPGVLSADPRRDSKAMKLNEISSIEAVEMTWYGATVIHPKTIKPLFEKNIPLEVKSFLDPGAKGTLINRNIHGHSPSEIACTIVRDQQILITITPHDMSFMQPAVLSGIFHAAERAGLQVNLVQTSAVSLVICANDQAAVIGEFTSLLLDEFEIQTESNLTLESWFSFPKNKLQEMVGARLIQQCGDKLFVVK